MNKLGISKRKSQMNPEEENLKKSDLKKLEKF